MKTALKLAFVLALLTGGYLILDSMIAQANTSNTFNRSLDAITQLATSNEVQNK